MSVNNGLGSIFLPYLSKFNFAVNSQELGFLAFTSAVIYITMALLVGRIEKILSLKNSLILFLSFQLMSFSSIFFITNKYQLFIPFVFVGLAQGGWWPLIEGAMCAQQNQAQKKQAVSVFNFSWLFGLIIGPIVAGYLYDIEKMLPLWGGIGLIIFIIGLALFPQSLKISPWKIGQNKMPTIPPSLKLFSQLGIGLNMLSYLFIGSFRSLLVEFTNPIGLSSTEFGLIQAALSIGMVVAMYFLMKSDFWQFSYKTILNALLLFVILLFSYAFSTNFYLLFILTLFLGAPIALFYFSSLYYGMLDHEGGSDHGGKHEAMIGAGQSIGPLISGLLISLSGFGAKIMFLWTAAVFISVYLYLSRKKSL
jgi:MFS family permease